MATKEAKFKWDNVSTQKAKDMYVPGDVSSVEMIAKELNVSKRSVIGKLTNLGVYEAPKKEEKPIKADEGPTKKQILKALADSGKIAIDGAEGASKAFLTELAGKLEVELPAR
jgi:hypothetical protein